MGGHDRVFLRVANDGLGGGGGKGTPHLKLFGVRLVVGVVKNGVHADQMQAACGAGRCARFYLDE